MNSYRNVQATSSSIDFPSTGNNRYEFITPGGAIVLFTDDGLIIKTASATEVRTQYIGIIRTNLFFIKEIKLTDFR